MSVLPEKLHNFLSWGRSGGEEWAKVGDCCSSIPYYPTTLLNYWNCEIDSLQPLYFSTHVKEKASEANAKPICEGGEASEANENKLPTPYPVKSPMVLLWRPVLLRIYPRVQRSNKNTR